MKINFDKKELEFIANKFNLRLVVLFGSQAKKTQTPSSDIDIAVLSYAPFDLENHLRLIAAFQDLFATEKIDLVDLNIASPLLRYEVLTGGKVLLDHDTAFHAAAHIRALRDYEDTKHFREVQFKAMQAHLKNGTFGKLNV